MSQIRRGRVTPLKLARRGGSASPWRTVRKTRPQQRCHPDRGVSQPTRDLLLRVQT